jgi:uncharacterized membrane protein
MTEPKPDFPRLRRVDAGAPFQWLRLGLADLKACPGAGLFYGFCFALAGYLIAWILRDSPQYLAAATAGFLLVAPALSIGIYEVSRRRERGEPCALAPTLMAWRENTANIGLFSLVLLMVFLIWARASLVSFAMFFSGAMPDVRSMLAQVSNPENLGFLVAWLAIGAVFALLVFAISVVTIPLMMDRRHDAVTAALVSVQVVFKNPGAMAMWAAIIAWSCAAGLLMGFIGIIVVAPLLGHATWHAYRDLVEAAP